MEDKYTTRHVLKELKKRLERITIDHEAFESTYPRHPDKHYYVAHLQTLIDGELRFTVDDFAGRVHTAITNLYKGLRRFLRVDGSDDVLWEVDIKNSQPLFLGIAAKKENVDVARWLKLCEQGVIYEFFAERMNMTRKEVKTRVIAMLYSKSNSRSKVKAIFQKEFPALAEYVQAKKDKVNKKGEHDGHRELAREMQFAERQFIIDIVCPEVLKGGRFLTTIHDSLLLKKEDKDFALQVMKEKFFSEHGINPILESKQC